LIHAATMVAAGVYVVARLFPLFAAAPVALTVLAVMASITMLIGAVAALAQDDIKRVLAWSTVSQLGYMTGALAVGVPAAAMFHLLTHAAFKALLFLAAGVVIHAVGSNSLAAMGGLRRTMPATFVAATVGLAALAGVPPFAGFWSKDAIIAAAWERDRAVAAVMVATAVLTAWYATRLWLRAFFGRPRGPAAAAAHEPVWAMRAPVLLLAVPAALLGFAGIGTGLAARLESAAHQIGLDPTARPAGVTSTLHLAHLGADTVPALLAVATGCLGAWFVWRRDPAADPAETGLGPLVSVSRHAFWLDDVQNALVVRPVAALARVTRRADEGLVDGAVEGVGRGVLGGGGLLQRAHRGALPRAATATLAGGVLAALTAVVVEALR
jgi:NADH-quinone oxidoreductase subunit L